MVIEPKTMGENSQKIGVILLVEHGIGIHVNLSHPHSECHLKGIKVSHNGNLSTELKQELIEHQHILNIFEDHKKEMEQLDHEYVNRVVFSKVENMIVYAERGRVHAVNCMFSLNYLVKACSLTIPAICIDKEGEMSISDSEIKGNSAKSTIGVICKLGSIVIENSVISDHQEGGVLAWGIKGNNSRLIKNKIQNNSVGIHAVGEEYSMKVCLNQVEGNAVGLKVGIGCEVEISRNSITDNGSGIEINSAFPTIYLNKINRQEENGIVSRTYKKMLCKATIKKNICIAGNRKNGILIEGENNKTKVVENYLIGFNGEAGIKVAKEAFPLILKNKIYKNHREGILVIENTNAVIEKNVLSHNIDCNVALGGVNSHHTLVVENSIANSPGPGIVLVEASSYICRNDITGNFDGIALLNSRAQIRRNFISGNNNGVTCQDFSAPVLIENFLTRNISIGLFFRDKSGLAPSRIHSNIIISNEINVGLENRHEDLVKELEASNTIDGEVDQPTGLLCALM